MLSQCCTNPDPAEEGLHGNVAEQTLAEEQVYQFRDDSPMQQGEGYPVVPDLSEVNGLPVDGTTALLQDLIDGRPGGMEVGEQELVWMNYMGKVMWKYAREVLKTKAKKEMMEKLQNEINRHKELKVDEITIDYDPGSRPPTIKKLRTYEKTQQEFHGLQMDLDIDWETEDFICTPTIKGTGPMGTPLDMVKVSVKGFHLTGTASIVLAPLVGKEPCFAAQQLFFFNPPSLKLMVSATGLGGGMLDKLIMPIIKKTTLTVLSESFILPHRMLVKVRKDIPLEELIKVKSPLPIGILEIEVLEAKRLLASDADLVGGKGSSDPFVEISVGDRKIRSTTIHNSLNPVWSDGNDYLLIYNLDQKVQIAVFDDDALSEDDLLGFLPGYSVYHLCKEIEKKNQGEWLKLRQDPNLDADKDVDAGELKIRCRFLDLSELSQINMAPAPTKHHRAPIGADPKLKDLMHSYPKLVTVKLLGMEGEHAKSFVGARARVEFSPVLPHDEENPSSSSFIQRGTKAFWSGVDALGRHTRKIQAVTGLGFGHRNTGVATEYRSCKAMLWGETIGQKQSQSSGISPVVVRAIERLRTRENWTLAQIADMFGISEEEARVAADLRSNFEVAWHQAFHFLQQPDVPGNSGKVRIQVNVPMLSEASAAAQALVGSSGLLGQVQLDLGSAPHGPDKPYCRRVRARLRRENAGFPQTGETLKGEGQCDQIGEAVPGILIEFLVEIRDLHPNEAHAHLEQGQVPLSRKELHGPHQRAGNVEVVSVA